MEEVKKFRVLSVAKIAGLFGVLVGLLSGLVSLIALKLFPSETLIQMYGAVPNINLLQTLILTPILMAVIYFITGAIFAAFYNLFAGWIGGIKIEFKGKK